MAFLLLFALLFSAQAFAAETQSIEIGFTVNKNPGTVTMTPMDGAPAAVPPSHTGKTEGIFTLSFDEHGNYQYAVSQSGSDAYVIYDETV